VNALANKEVGKYLNEYFCSSFQKVATFKVVGKQKQGGNVAAYFCAPDGRVLHCVAGPVNASTMLKEARWVVETTKKAMAHAKNDGAKFKVYFRQAHADKVKNEFGLNVEPVTFDPPEPQDAKSALTYNDPSGQPLAPRLPPPPIDGPDVTLRAKELQADAARAPGSAVVLDKKGGRWRLGTQGRVDQLLAAHSMIKIEKIYGTVFENILGEKISTKPVEVITPFPWAKDNPRAKLALKKAGG
jgi:hypothetical protein